MANQLAQIILTAVDRTKAAFASVKGSLSSLAATVSSMSGLFGSIFTGLSVVAFVGKIKQSIDAMDAARESAMKIGTSTSSFTALAYAAGQSGISVEELEGSMIKLARSIETARTGAGPAADAFRALQLDPKKFNDPADALDALAERFAKMPDSVSKTALAMDLFGKSGAQMIPLLNEGRAGIQALKDEAEKLGIVIGDDAAAAADQFNDSMDKLKKSTDGLGVKVASEMLPGMQQIVNAMNEAAKEGDILKTAWVGLGGLGAALFTDDLLTASQKLAKTQAELNDVTQKGWESTNKYVIQLQAQIEQLKKTVAAEDAAKQAEEKTAAARKRSGEALAQAVEDRKAAQAEGKKITDEQIKDAERLQRDLGTAFEKAIQEEKNYRDQARKLRAEANAPAEVATDPESQAVARLAAIAAVMKLQREASTASLSDVQEQAAATQALAAGLTDIQLKEELVRQAKLAEAAALDAAAAQEKARYEGLAAQQEESVRQATNLKAALDGIGKEVSVAIKVSPETDAALAKLREIKQLLSTIGNLGPMQASAAPSGTSDIAASLRTQALQYGRR